MKFRMQWLIAIVLLISACGGESFSQSPSEEPIRRRPPAIDPEPPIPDPPQPTIPTGTVSIGFGQKDITPPIGVPLAGFGGGDRRNAPWDFWNEHPYAYFLAPSEGILDPVRSKVMVVRNKEGQKLLFMSLDLVGVTSDVISDLTSRFAELGFEPHEVFISATHTHSGPGTLSKNFAWQLIAMDRFKKNIYDYIVGQIYQSAVDAVLDMKEGNLYSTQTDVQGLQRNRRGKEGHYDSEARFLLATDSQGIWLGGMVNFAVHGTAYGTDNKLFSADFPGAIERELELRLKRLNCLSENSENESQSDCMKKHPVTFLFTNAAVGDVSPSFKKDDSQSGEIETSLSEVDQMAEHFGDQFIPSLFQKRLVVPFIKTHMRKVKLGTPSFHFEGCEGFKDALWGIVAETGVNVSVWMPKETNLHAVELGDLVMVSWPGEPTTSVGERLKGVIRKLTKMENVWPLGLTNDYLAYFTMPEEWKEPSYETCSSLYGTRGTGIILRNYYQMFRNP